MQTIVLNWNDLASGKPMKELKQAFARAGTFVVTAESDNKVKKSVGVEYKTLNMSFNDGQKVSMDAKKGGDVFSVRVNNRVLPIKNHDNILKAALEIINAMDKGRKRFQATQARKKVELPKGMKSTTRKKIDILTEKNTELDIQITEATQRRDELKTELGLDSVSEEVIIMDIESALDGVRKYNEKDYAFWVVSAGKIVSGWEFKEDAKESIDDLPTEIRSKRPKILKLQGLKAASLDPNNNGDWYSGNAMDAAIDADEHEPKEAPVPTQVAESSSDAEQEKAGAVKEPALDAGSVAADTGEENRSEQRDDNALDSVITPKTSDLTKSIGEWITKINEAKTCDDISDAVKGAQECFDCVFRGIDNAVDIMPTMRTIELAASYIETALDGVKFPSAVEILTQAANVCDTNMPINLEKGEFEQAQLEQANSIQFKAAIAALDSTGAGEGVDDTEQAFDFTEKDLKKGRKVKNKTNGEKGTLNEDWDGTNEIGVSVNRGGNKNWDVEDIALDGADTNNNGKIENNVQAEAAKALLDVVLDGVLDGVAAGVMDTQPETAHTEEPKVLEQAFVNPYAGKALDCAEEKALDYGGDNKFMNPYKGVESAVDDAGASVSVSTSIAPNSAEVSVVKPVLDECGKTHKKFVSPFNSK